MTVVAPTRDAAIKKIDKRIWELWECHRRLLQHTTADDYARLWRQIDTLLDKRLDWTRE